MKWYIIVFLSLVLFGCDIIKGPAGPQGPPGAQGPSGEDLEIAVISGTLLAGDMIDGGDFVNRWEIDMDVTDDHIVTVYVRKGVDYPWLEPIWDLGEWEGVWYIIIYELVPIYESEPVGSGYEYRIAMAN